MGLRPVAAPAFLSGKAKGGKHFRGQVCMVANNALPQCGTHITPLFQVPSPFPLDLSFLFASCGSFPFHLSFIPISRPSPSFDTVSGLEERCKLPQRVRAEPGRQMQFGEF